MTKASSGGFTLLETIVAVSLFALGVVSILELLPRAQAASSDATDTLIATYLAQRRLEELKNIEYDDLSEEAKEPVTDPPGLERFSRQVSVSTPISDLAQIIVSVFWNSPGGEVNVSLQTYRFAD
jgi:type II secretory pathway pseudopilin PulG